MFNNNLFSNATMSVIMGEPKNRQALDRLLESAAKQGVRGPSALAKRLGETEQTITNWAARGISKRGVIKAQAALSAQNRNHTLPHTLPPNRLMAVFCCCFKKITQNV